ncbi:hypothetical protein AAC387_Pa06g2039 [Persea americana]
MSRSGQPPDLKKYTDKKLQRFLSFLILPILAKNTYISENALMPVSANPMFSGQDVLEANKMVKELLGLRFGSEELRMLIEGIVRSVNNLLEKFHQSFFLYFLTSPNKFVSVGVYMIGFALLVLPLPVLAAALYSGIKLGNTDKGNQTPSINSHSDMGLDVRSWRWLHAAKVVLVVHLWGVIVLLLPHLINQLPQRTSETSMLTWTVVSIFILVILYQISGAPHSHSGNVTPTQYQSADWAILKAVTVASAAIGLGLMSIINFAAAQIGAMLLVPMCLIVHPLKHMGHMKVLKAVLLLTCNLALAILGFPPAALLILKVSSEGLGGRNLGDFWDWMESLWAWNSATYLYLVLVHLRCWVLCIHILLHPL